MREIYPKLPLIIISGPTASGKTSCGLKLAGAFGKKACIVNFDSLLFYKELNIGTAKPTLKERALIQHRLIDIQSAKKPINASDFVSLARQEIDKGHREGKIIFLIGGSAFYLRALIKGMYETETTPKNIKKELEELYKEQGIGPIVEILREKDPESLSQLHLNDHYRLIRAAEFFLTTGEKISIEKKKMDEKNPYDLTSDEWNIFHIYLNPPKDIHQKIIEKRTREMIELGLIDEVSELLKNGFTGEEKPLNSIGYKEAQNFLKGELKDMESLIERIIISTRQLAKSQRTFFKKITPKNTYDPLKDEEKIEKDVADFLKKNYTGQA
ncbi:MAG: tRNA (adenosine(37)-N6)-dimethylallyltransferase MiaA [Deltaproteobacteria bacterium]|nr:MAG: tRNA (adenosine(37)-N6)-dimethylallyltransferase MiaA [Deltaproteobacteria bacterium]